MSFSRVCNFIFLTGLTGFKGLSFWADGMLAHLPLEGHASSWPDATERVPPIAAFPLDIGYSLLDIGYSGISSSSPYLISLLCLPQIK
jgi:hypothetical protein